MLRKLLRHLTHYRTMFSVNRGGFIGELWASFKSIHGLTITALAFLAALILYIFDFSDNPSGRIIVSMHILMYTLLILLVVTSLDAAYRLHRAAKGRLPRVILGRNPPAGSQATLTCMLEPSELFSYGIAVSIYEVDDEGFESLARIGNVANIQGDGRIQVLMQSTRPGHEEFAESIKRNEQKAIRAARVKPSVEQQFFVGYGEPE